MPEIKTFRKFSRNQTGNQIDFRQFFLKLASVLGPGLLITWGASVLVLIGAFFILCGGGTNPALEAHNQKIEAEIGLGYCGDDDWIAGGIVRTMHGHEILECGSEASSDVEIFKLVKIGEEPEGTPASVRELPKSSSSCKRGKQQQSPADETSSLGFISLDSTLVSSRLNNNALRSSNLRLNIPSIIISEDNRSRSRSNTKSGSGTRQQTNFLSPGKSTQSARSASPNSNSETESVWSSTNASLRELPRGDEMTGELYTR